MKKIILTSVTLLLLNSTAQAQLKINTHVPKKETSPCGEVKDDLIKEGGYLYIQKELLIKGVDSYLTMTNGMAYSSSLQKEKSPSLDLSPQCKLYKPERITKKYSNHAATISTGAARIVEVKDSNDFTILVSVESNGKVTQEKMHITCSKSTFTKDLDEKSIFNKVFNGQICPASELEITKVKVAEAKAAKQELTASFENPAVVNSQKRKKSPKAEGTQLKLKFNSDGTVAK